MLYAGLDLSLTGTGLYILDDTGTSILAEKLHVPQTGVERLFFLRAKLRETLDPFDISFACLESAAYNDTGRLFDLGSWYGIVALYLYERSLPCISASPLQLKKYISSVGKNQGKQVVILDIYKEYSLTITDDNKADAFVLANIAKDYHTLYIRQQEIPNLKPFRKDVLKKIQSSNSVQKNLII